MAGCPNTFTYALVDADNSVNLASNPVGMSQPVPAAAASVFEITPLDDSILNNYQFYLKVEASGDFTTT